MSGLFLSLRPFVGSMIWLCEGVRVSPCSTSRCTSKGCKSREFLFHISCDEMPSTLLPAVPFGWSNVASLNLTKEYASLHVACWIV